MSGSGRSRIGLEPTEVDDDGAWSEAAVVIERDGWPEPGLRTQVLVMTPAEMTALYHQMRQYYERGMWSTGTVER